MPNGNKHIKPKEFLYGVLQSKIINTLNPISTELSNIEFLNSNGTFSYNTEYIDTNYPEDPISIEKPELSFETMFNEEVNSHRKDIEFSGATYQEFIDSIENEDEKKEVRAAREYLEYIISEVQKMINETEGKPIAEASQFFLEQTRKFSETLRNFNPESDTEYQRWKEEKAEGALSERWEGRTSRR